MGAKYVVVTVCWFENTSCSSCLSSCNVSAQRTGLPIAVAVWMHCSVSNGQALWCFWTRPKFQVEQLLGNLQKLTQVGGRMGLNHEKICCKAVAIKLVPRTWMFCWWLLPIKTQMPLLSLFKWCILSLQYSPVQPHITPSLGMISCGGAHDSFRGFKVGKLS